MPTYRHGRHEHGQNFLTNTSIASKIISIVADTTGPIIEIGPGDGALTTRLARLGRPLTAVEIDAHFAGRLKRRFPSGVQIVRADFLSYRLPRHPHVLVGNLPFHLTTAILRRIFRAPGWTDAVLLVQWEVARRRAGVGRSTMMTAQWSPWFEFRLHGRVPANAFTPRPGVDGGILSIHRRERPAVALSQMRQFQSMVHRVFTAPGKGLSQMLMRSGIAGSSGAAKTWLSSRGLRASALPGDLDLDAWVDLHRASGVSPPQERNR